MAEPYACHMRLTGKPISGAEKAAKAEESIGSSGVIQAV
ncbi:hypothetical protein HDF12_003946 [Edaphobacter lichenicola]|uniref:Uncharacterized protein n=1 Tax=Tunturiibacter lichenicola TaxID=2051959 RepID=A0A7Y9T4J8_9BACT|nr:hypothetical protein [Edaphobacter lichenicola]